MSVFSFYGTCPVHRKLKKHDLSKISWKIKSSFKNCIYSIILQIAVTRLKYIYFQNLCRICTERHFYAMQSCSHTGENSNLFNKTSIIKISCRRDRMKFTSELFIQSYEGSMWSFSQKSHKWMSLISFIVQIQLQLKLNELNQNTIRLCWK